MQYALIMYHDEKAGASLPKDEMDAWIARIQAWSESMRQAGLLVKAMGLLPTSAAASMRVRDGKRLTTHGPFAETKEQLGGLYLIECADLDQALDWAAQAPGAEYGTVEVRPVWDMGLKAAIAAARDQGFLKA